MYVCIYVFMYIYIYIYVYIYIYIYIYVTRRRWAREGRGWTATPQRHLQRHLRDTFSCPSMVNQASAGLPATLVKAGVTEASPEARLPIRCSTFCDKVQKGNTLEQTLFETQPHIYVHVYV